MSGDLIFNNFLQNLSERGVWAFKTIMKIFSRFFLVYLVTESSEKLIIKSIGLSWLEFRRDKDSEKSLEMRSLQRYPQPWIEVILARKVEWSKINPKQ